MIAGGRRDREINTLNFTNWMRRGYFLKGNLLVKLQDPEKGQAALEQSFDLYRSYAGGKSVQGHPRVSDFEDLVVFWSK